MRQTIQIGRRTIGDGHPLFVMAECGVTCTYDMKITKELIDVVRDSGADAIKLIFWFPDEIMSDRSVAYTYETVDGTRTENMFEMLEGLRFSLDQWREIKAYADAREVVLFATVNSPSGVEYAETLGLHAYKLSSWDFNHLPLWRRIAALGKPMLIDTGPVTTVDVAKVMQVMQDTGNDQSVLVHCFHTDRSDEMNMRTLPYMRRAFNTLVGYSSKDQADETDIMGVTLGAVVVEKRLTLDRRLPGHHHILSKEPKEFEEYVRLMRSVQAALGEEDLRPSPTDTAERRKWFRHLVANQDIPAGTTLTADLLEGKRPEAGISPEFLDVFVGRTTRRALRKNEAISWDLV
jgi:sialic acid synthase SpsE